MSFLLLRAQAESVLVGRCGKVLTIAGLDGTTVDGTNADLAGPMLYALGFLGIIPAAYPSVVDADLVSISPGSADAPGSLAAFIDISELQARGNAIDAMTDVDEQVDRDAQKLSQLVARWQAKANQLAAFCKAQYGLGADSLQSGSIDLGFQQRRPFGWGCGPLGGEWP
jgi:hypothetical protein